MALYFTGDTHGEFGRFFDDPEFLINANYFKNCTPENDIVAIAGDFGGVWFNENKRGSYLFKHAEKELDKLAKLPVTIVFIDGNHENFPRLDTYPEEEKFGGPVNRIRDNIFRLKQRGHIYELLEALRASTNLCGRKVLAGGRRKWRRMKIICVVSKA